MVKIVDIYWKKRERIGMYGNGNEVFKILYNFLIKDLDLN